ncbi:hypothetical protein G6659_01685 [Polynucleobacter paneuropaeus]|nr:hypothetical protein G6659_01685 [Polynucleobacter paneuropaeus]
MTAIFFNGSYPLIPFTIKTIKALIENGIKPVLITDTLASELIIKINLNSKYYKKLIKYCFENYNCKKLNNPDVPTSDLKFWISDIERATYYKFNNINNKLCGLINLNFPEFLVETIKKEGIKKIIYEPVSNAYSYLMYELCKGMKLDYVGIHQSRIKGCIDVVSIAGSLGSRSFLENNPKFDDIRISSEQAFEQFKGDINNPRPYQYKEGIFIRSLAMSLFVPFIKLFYILKTQKKFCYYQYPSPVKFSFIRLVERVLNYRKVKINKFPRLQENYYLYFCHFHPESSTSVLSPEYINDEQLIMQISTLLEGCNLLIKPHPQSIIRFSKFFIDYINNHPNLYVSTKKSIDLMASPQCRGVISVAGSVGLESICLNKSTYVFADVFYVDNEICKKVDIGSLKSQLIQYRNSHLGSKRSFKYFQKYSIKSNSLINSWSLEPFDDNLTRVLCS